MCIKYLCNNCDLLRKNIYHIITNDMVKRNSLVMRITHKKENIVDTILRIMNEDDGPQTKRILKNTAQKRRNGADRFNADHKKAYEELSKENRDKIATIKHHNNAYPKLYDELDRRKSIVTVTTAANAVKFDSRNGCTREDVQKYDPKCGACSNLMKLNELKKMNIKPKCSAGRRPRAKLRRRKSRNRRVPRHTHKEKPRASSSHDRKPNEKNSRDRLTGVIKPKSRMCQNTNKKMSLTSKMKLSGTQSSAQHSFANNSKTASNIQHYEENNKSNQQSSEATANTQDTKDTSATKNTSKSSQMSGKSSMTSYNSYMSMEHEPMVTS